MRSNLDCRYCGEPMRQTAFLQPLDGDPAQRVYGCERCGEMAWLPFNPPQNVPQTQSG